jgi:hypothetical protein
MEANALVFYASLSVFDQFLPDDPCINRLEYNLKSWTMICESSFISKVLFPSHLVVLGVLTVVRWSCTDVTDSYPEWMRRSSN